MNADRYRSVDPAIRAAIPIVAAACVLAGCDLQARQWAEDSDEIRIGRVEREGIGIGLTFAAAGGDAEAEIMEAEELTVRVALTDLETGGPLDGAAIAGWIDHRSESETPPDACHARIERYLQGTLRGQPVVNLNSYFVLALNEGNSISVIDPFLGFGSSKLYTAVVLKSPGEDWLLSDDGTRLFVSMPLVNAVAVVNTATFDIESDIQTGPRPVRLALEPDGRHLWVGNDGIGGSGGGGVSVIDTRTLEAVARIPTGAGHHEIEFGPDGRLAFVTNSDDGTLTVIDVAKRTAIASVETGAHPSALAYSPVGRAVYVVHEGDGSVVVIDTDEGRVRTRLEGSPGLTAIGFDRSGRWGFLLNTSESLVHILDARTDEVRHTVTVGDHPHQVTFTESFAYVRSLETSDVAMIPISGLEEDELPAMQPFPAGQMAPAKFGGVAAAPAIAALPEMSDAVYAPNPGEKAIYVYHYMEGMPTPSGSLNNYGFEPRAVLTVGRNLRETGTGLFETTVRMPAAGDYDFLLLLDEPRVIHCFGFTVEPDPDGGAADEPVKTVTVEPLLEEKQLNAGEEVELRFRLSDAATGLAIEDLEDVRVMLSTTAGWQKRLPARERGDGIYEVRLTVPRSGVYYLFAAVPSLGVDWQDQFPVALRTAE